jgi:hypothetical protein
LFFICKKKQPFEETGDFFCNEAGEGPGHVLVFSVAVRGADDDLATGSLHRCTAPKPGNLLFNALISFSMHTLN